MLILWFFLYIGCFRDKKILCIAIGLQSTGKWETKYDLSYETSGGSSPGLDFSEKTADASCIIYILLFVSPMNSLFRRNS